MLREKLAMVQHQIWTSWMAHLFSVCVQNQDGTYTIPADKVQRWKRQMRTPYQALSESEREGDREQADKVIEVIRCNME